MVGLVVIVCLLGSGVVVDWQRKSALDRVVRIVALVEGRKA